MNSPEGLNHTKWECHRLLGLLKVKVPYPWHEPIWDEEKTSQVRVSGQEGIMFQQLAEVRQLDLF